MREIKFRAWDKKDKVMREVYGIQFPKISNHGDRKNTIIEMHCSDYEGQRAIILSDFTDNIERVEVMQYTGLKDKNGKEIYEGDILKHDTYTYFFTVSFDHGCFIITTGIMNKLHFCEDRTDEKVEIIGNIYENPELLNK